MRIALAVIALGPTLVYLLVSEAMYALWEAGAASASAPSFAQIVGGLVGSLLVAPGDAMLSPDVRAQVAAAVGYSGADSLGHAGRWFHYHLPMFTTAAVVMAGSIALALAARALGRRQRRAAP